MVTLDHQLLLNRPRQGSLYGPHIGRYIHRNGRIRALDYADRAFAQNAHLLQGAFLFHFTLRQRVDYQGI